MLLTNWADVLVQSFQNIGYGLAALIPNLIIAVIIFIIGWLFGIAIGRLVAQVVRSLHIDTALRSAGVDKVVHRAGYKLDSGAFLGALVKWFFIILFVLAALQTLGLTEVDVFLSTVVLTYLPHVIVAVIILLAAAVIADVAQRVVVGSAAAANITSANLAGSIARWAIWIFALLAALSELQIASNFMQILFTGVVVALALAFGLAFGLGGQQAAADLIKRVRQDVE